MCTLLCALFSVRCGQMDTSARGKVAARGRCVFTDEEAPAMLLRFRNAGGEPNTTRRCWLPTRWGLTVAQRQPGARRHAIRRQPRELVALCNAALCVKLELVIALFHGRLVALLKVLGQDDIPAATRERGGVGGRGMSACEQVAWKRTVDEAQDE